MEFFTLDILGIFQVEYFWSIFFPSGKFFGILWIANFSNFPRWIFLEFSKLTIYEVFQIGNLWNFKITNFTNFPNWTFLEFSKLKIFGTFQIGNFWNFLNWKFSELFRLAIFGIFQIANFSNFLNSKFFWIFRIEKFLEFFQSRKPKFG